MNSGNDNNNIRKKLLKLLFYEDKNENSGKKLLLRLFAEFMLVMFVFTFLSRSADSMTVAQVKMETPQERVIEHKVSADGKIIQNQEIAVTTEEGIQVATVNVSEGETVKAGDVLMVLSMSSLREAIREQRLQIQTLQLTNAGIYSSNQVEQQTRSRAKQRAVDDYNTAKSDGQREVRRAKRAWEKAKEKLQNYRKKVKQGLNKTKSNNRKTKQTKSFVNSETIMEKIESAENKGKQDEEKYAVENNNRGDDDDTESELVTLIDIETDNSIENTPATLVDIETGNNIENTPATSIDIGIDSNIGNVRICSMNAGISNNTDSKTNTMNMESSNTSENDNEESLLNLVEEAKTAYEDALKNYRNSLKTAKRAIEDAEVPASNDNSDKINDLQIAQYQRKLKKLEKLKKQKGKIYAPKAGVITSVGVLCGNMTTSDAAFRMADVSNGVKCTAQFSKEDAKYLTNTADVTLTTDSSDKLVENLSIDTVSANAEDSNLFDVTVNLSKNQFSIGENVQIEVNARSKEYPITVPLNAISEENGKDYVYVAREKDTVLGQEYYAQKVEVTVSDKNSSYATIEEGGIDAQQEVIISSNKTINNGDRIRKTE